MGTVGYSAIAAIAAIKPMGRITGFGLRRRLHSLVSGLIVMPLSQLLAACVTGLMLSDHLALRAMSTFASSQKQHDIGFVTILAIATLTLGCLTIISFFEPKGSFSTVGQVSHNPRFWVPGQLMPIEENLFSRTLRFY